ncbi:MAG: hypothetical protein AAGA83_23855, partial [Cyanobacteria bacterium P01_F01_bin.116]
MPHDLKPEKVDTWFPPEFQKRYTNHLIGKSGLTPTQARHFVRLWGYGHLQQYGPEQIPITVLKRKIDGFLCSHGDASKLFYAEENKGTPRSAGLMINKFVSKKLIRRETFNGTTSILKLRIPQVFDLPDEGKSEEVYTDLFDPRNDTPIVARFLEELYSYDGERPQALSFTIQQGLRHWAKRYPQGLKVLRRCKASQQPIGFFAIAPIHPKSARNFCMPPKYSRHLSRLDPDLEDPIELATPGDPDCYIAYIRSWQIRPDLWTHDNAFKLLEATKNTLRCMQKDYPGLSEIYSMNIHPR